MADALSLGATYSRPKGGRVPSPLGAHARPLSLLAAFFSHILMQRGLRFAPLRSVAWNRLWCDHDYPRWGGHKTSDSIPETHSCSAHRLLS